MGEGYLMFGGVAIRSSIVALLLVQHVTVLGFGRHGGMRFKEGVALREYNTALVW